MAEESYPPQGALLARNFLALLLGEDVGEVGGCWGSLDLGWVEELEVAEAETLWALQVFRFRVTRRTEIVAAQSLVAANLFDMAAHVAAICNSHVKRGQRKRIQNVHT